MVNSIMKPLIGISTREIIESEKKRTGHGVGVSYIESIAAAGGAPVLIPLLKDEQVLRSIFDSLDGILFPGGEDVHPKFYGEAPHPKLGDTNVLRDEVELTLCRWAFKENKPVMGLCRGIQLMNVALGGTLIQDIPSQHVSTTGHRQPDNSWEDTSHQLELKENSLIASVIQADSLPVNSFHHQAVAKVADSLVVVGESEDGIVEAVEAKDKSFFVGLQCHPEHLWQGPDERWLRLFRAFITAASSS